MLPATTLKGPGDDLFDERPAVAERQEADDDSPWVQKWGVTTRKIL